jgi:predicted enzyme related to lactoylglutathione lyase
MEITMHLKPILTLTELLGKRRPFAQMVRFGGAKHFLRQCLLGSFLITVGALPVTAAPLQLPAIVQSASHEHHLGKVIFVELVTPDLAVAKKFYAGLFGWTFRDIQSGRTMYAEAFLHGHPVAGLIHKDVPADKQRHTSWLSFLSAGNVDTMAKVALKNGAKVLLEPHNVRERGREAVFADPQGAVFAVLASSSGDPSDDLASPGEWIWSSLITSKPDLAAGFYQKLFDYEVFELPATTGASHLLFASEEYARASVNTLPANRPKAHPHWLNYVRVDDAVKMAQKVVELGGRVLVAPRVDRHGGKVTVVADPLGAPFGLLEWPDSESKEVPK